MASPSGSGSSVSTQLTASGAEEDTQPQQAVDLRKEKRKLSNRESARRSRMRKQKHLDDLAAQVAGLRRDKSQLLASLKAATQQHAAVESENSVLKAQVLELAGRLQSLDEMLQFVDEAGGDGRFLFCEAQPAMDGFLGNPWSSVHSGQPIMASAASMLQY